jgi:hypothetical protein
MKIATVTVSLVVALATVINAQTASTDEQQIRAQIAKIDAAETTAGGLATKDRIFWSGAYKRPAIAPARAEEIPGPRQVSQRKEGSQRNKTTPVRIEIAKSGDLAYEFSNSVVSFEMKDGQKVSLTGWMIRVWRKDAGEWRIAAQFSNPDYQEPAKK